MSFLEKILIFDLDGTLIDSFPGISASFKHTLVSLKYPEPRDEQIRIAIGPGLHKALENLLQSEDLELIEEAVKIYRAFHDNEGYKKSTLYPGISELLTFLKEQKISAFVASMKSDHIIKPILRHLGILEFFVDAVGSNRDGSTSSKSEMLIDLSSKYNFLLSNAILVGDTLHDANAAKQAQVDFFAVTYGYGLRAELEQVGYLNIFDDVKSLLSEIAGTTQLTNK